MHCRLAQTIQCHFITITNKAPDIYGITSNHLKHANMGQLLPIMTETTKKCFNTSKMPEVFKVSIITPVPKKDKLATDPNKFRRITASSLSGKVVEERMTSLSKTLFSTSQRRNQLGFTVSASPSNSSVLITELIAK